MERQVIFTTKALAKMEQEAIPWQIAVQITCYGVRKKLGNFETAYQKCNGEELSTLYTKQRDGRYKIIGVWRRRNKKKAKLLYRTVL